MSDPLGQLQSCGAWALRSYEYFFTHTVLERQEGAVQSDVEAALGTLNETGGKIGSCIMFMLPTIDCPSADAEGPQLDVILPIRFFEQPLVNRAEGGTEKTISETELNILARLHKLRIHPDFAPLWPDQRASVEIPAPKGKLAKEIYMRTKGTCKPIAKTRRPVFGGSAAAVTLNTETPASLIYYTTDGFSYPVAGRAGTVLYTEPFNVEAGTRVCAVAYAVNHYGSDLADEIMN